MAKLSQAVLLALNQLASSSNQALLLAKQDSLSYLRFLQEKSTSSFAVFGHLDFTGKTVLDLGCGLGANLVHLCALGARRVYALDFDSKQLDHTQTMLLEHHPELISTIPFIAADAADMPFYDNSIDIIISADSFEHIFDLPRALQECNRILRPGGLVYAYFPPFYAPWGAHMINWIRLPWCQVFFFEATITSAARHIERQSGSTNSELPPETQLDLQQGDVIPFVNHLTLSQFENMIDADPRWKIVERCLLPPNWRTDRWISKLLRPLTTLPVLREMFTAKAFFVLKKPEFDWI